MRFVLVDTPWLERVPVAVEALAFDTDADDALMHLDMTASAPGPEASTLLEEFDLVGQIQVCRTDFDRAVRLCAWVHSRWQHVSAIPSRPSSAVDILRRAARGERFRCAEYGLVLGRVLNAVGLPARSLGLRTLDVETRTSGAGHVGTDVYLRDARRWVFFDPQFDLVALQHDRPLSAVGLQDALASGEPVEYRTSSETDTDRYRRIIAPYLVFFNVGAIHHDLASESWDVSLVPKGLAPPNAFEGVAYTGANRVATNSLATFYPGQ